MFQRPGDSGCDGGIGAERRGDHDQVGVVGRYGWIVRHLIGETEPGNRRPGIGIAVAGYDGPHQTMRPDRPCERRPNQSKTDNGNTIEYDVGHRLCGSFWKKKASIPAISCVSSSSVPMVMRRQSGRP